MITGKDSQEIPTDKIVIGQNTFKANASVLCTITKKLVPIIDATQGNAIRPSVFELIRISCPEFSEEKYISEEELSKFKSAHIRGLLASERGKLSDMEREVAETVAKHDFMSKDFTKEEAETFTFGEKVADHISDFGGSWRFIIIFVMLMIGWIGINVFWNFSSKAFDPYPFILLNLVLSCIAALQAPVIMMSQHRAEKKDRARAINNYMVGLKTEIEIRHLHEKTDRLLAIHIQNENEMHELQMETLEKIIKKIDALDRKVKK